MMENVRWQMANAENLSLAMLPVHVNEAVLLITDVHGRSITSFVLTANHGQQIWDIRDVKKGVYLYTLKAGTMSKNGILIIQ